MELDSPSIIVDSHSTLTILIAIMDFNLSFIKDY